MKRLILMIILFCGAQPAFAQKLYMPDSVCTDFGTWAYQTAQSRDRGVKITVVAEAIETYVATTRLTLGERLAVDMMQTALPSIYGAPKLSPAMVKAIMVQACFDARKRAANK